MKMHLDFVQFLPEWKIPEKYLQDKEVIELLMEEVKYAIENFGAEIYQLKEDEFTVWKFADTDKEFTVKHLYICEFCNLNILDFLKKCVRLSLGTEWNCSIENIISTHNNVDWDDIYFMEIPEKRKLRLCWLKQLEAKLKEIV